MITSAALAKTLYQTWASKMDTLEPLQETIEPYTSSGTTIVLDRIKLRPKWHVLTSLQQQVWINIADVAIQNVPPSFHAIGAQLGDDVS